jgi:hypothetical protein
MQCNALEIEDRVREVREGYCFKAKQKERVKESYLPDCKSST